MGDRKKDKQSVPSSSEEEEGKVFVTCSLDPGRAIGHTVYFELT
jgi:hypothetical protein